MEPIPALPPLAPPADPADGAAAVPAPANVTFAGPTAGAGQDDASPSVPFDALFAELQSYQQAHGTLSIPAHHPTVARITDLLIAQGFEAQASARWDDMLAQLRAYKLERGNCNVPPDHPTLGRWVAEQREHYQRHERGMTSPLTDARYDQLRGLGLTSNRWERRLDELREYRAQHGHCDVPLEYPGLGVWVMNQRDTYYFEREDMPQDRVDALEALGFNWNRWGRKRLKIREDAWDTQYAKLLEFIKEYGHSNISQHDKQYEKLGKWVKNQRYEYRKYHNKGLGQSRLGRDRIDKLNEIGFQWRLRPEKVPWDTRFKALVEFKEEHGHCRVPMSVPELGKWAKYQRDQYVLFMRGKKKQAKITQEKVDKLISVGFEESLEERVAIGLAGEGEVEQHMQQQVPMQQGEMAGYPHHDPGMQHMGQEMGQQPVYAEQYHPVDPGHAYGGAPPPPQGQPGAEAYHYQHGMHYPH